MTDHPATWMPVPPDGGDLFDRIAQIAPDAAALPVRAVDHPVRLYRFEEN